MKNRKMLWASRDPSQKIRVFDNRPEASKTLHFSGWVIRYGEETYMLPQNVKNAIKKELQGTSWKKALCRIWAHDWMPVKREPK